MKLGKDYLIDDLDRHPFLAPIMESKIRQVRSRFGDLLFSDARDGSILSLFTFAALAPFSYFSRKQVKSYLNFFLESDTHIYLKVPEVAKDVGHGLLSLVQQRPFQGLEDTFGLDAPSDYEELEQRWHPEYQRLAEHVLSPLINLPLAILGARTGKNLTARALSLRAQDVQQDSRLHGLGSAYNSLLRNAIAHGGVRFERSTIVYSDRRREIKIDIREFLRQLDRLLVACASLAAALLLYLHWNYQLLRNPPRPLLPALCLLYLKGAASFPGFMPERTTVTSTASGGTVTSIICETDTPSASAHLFNALHVARLAIDFFPSLDGKLVVTHCCDGETLNTVPIWSHRLRDALYGDGDSPIVDASQYWPYESVLFRKLWTLKTAWRVSLLRERDRLRALRAGYQLMLRSDRPIGADRRRRELVAVLASDAPREVDRCVQTLYEFLARIALRPSFWRAVQIAIFVFEDDMPVRRFLDPEEFVDKVLIEVEWVAPGIKGLSRNIKEPSVTYRGISFRFAEGF
jgi:hypothetical protein